MMKTTTMVAALALVLGANALTAKPLKVYLMAGQSNMQGHCKLTTFPYLAMDPQAAPILKKMVNEDGTPRVIDKVWISSLGTGEEEKFGKLTTGFGAERSGPKIGPELTFGIYMQEHLGEPVLLIKASWGGTTLCRDFRPPSAGLHPVQAQRLEELRKNNEDTKKAEEEYAKRAGNCYRQMIAHAKSVLADIKRVDPEYDPAQGYELAGFVWLQGESDFGNTETYPNPGQPGGYDEYSRLLACLIRDIRKNLGNDEKKAAIDAFLKTVYTPEEWKLMEIGVSNATYHYLGSAKIMARMGKAFADAMADLSK
jgi:alpha-galactosidase